jgi:hypothetical protein
MRCASCTTELWGNPEVCPVCGSPTGLSAPRGRRSRGPRADPPEAPPPQRQQPPHSSGLLNPPGSGNTQAPQGGSLFNAADLLDPQVLKALPLPNSASEDGAAQAAAPATPGNLDVSQQQPMINATDLFDPALLAELGGGRVENPPAASTPQDNWLSGSAPPEVPPLDPRAGQQPIRQTSGPAVPFLSLPPLAMPPTPARPSAPIRNQPPPQAPRGARIANAPDMPGLSEEVEEPPGRGWNIVAPEPPVRPRSRPTPQGQPGSSLVPYPPAPYPQMPVPQPPPRRGQAHMEPHHGLLATIGGWLSLLLVLSIISVAILFAAIRYFQLQDTPATGAQSPGTLPTIAPRAGYTIFRDAALGFSIQIPTVWSKQADVDKSDPSYRGDLFQINVDAAFEVGSSPQYQNWSAGQIDDYILSNMPGLSNVSTFTTSASTASSIPIAGLNWTPENATITLDNGLVLQASSVAVNYNGRGYVIFYYTTQQVFNSYDSQYFEPALLTFRLLNIGQ